MPTRGHAMNRPATLFRLSASLAALLALAGCKSELVASLPGEPSKEVRQQARLCEGGDQHGCHNLAVALEYGEGVGVDSARANALYEQACEEGLDLSCRRIAANETAGQDSQRGETLLRQSCEAGSREACVDLAERWIAAGEVGAAYDRLLATCHEGSTAACMALGRHFVLGTFGEPDPTTAAQLFDQPCTQGLAEGCRRRAEALHTLQGADAAPSREIVALYGQACISADGPACATLAELYTRGFGVDEDPDYAAELRVRACTYGHQPSCTVADEPD